MSVKATAAALALLAGCATTLSQPAFADAAEEQGAWASACRDFDEWDKPGPPFRVYGGTYYVGTCGIAALLVTGQTGHVLIDSGTDEGAKIVLENIRALGFDPRAVDFILMSHEHFDHVGGMARLQQATGATVLATREAAAVLQTGRVSPDDPQSRSNHPDFPPVAASFIKQLTGERPQKLGDTTFHPIFTPGHTLGATSWRWTECEGDSCKSIAYLDSLNPISSDGYRFSDHPALVTGFRAGLAKVASAPCDIVLTTHPSAAGLRDRLAGTKPLVDPVGCRAFAAIAAERMDQRLATESASGG